ncbi:hypothetical protein ACMFMG_000765 [Clarireedia jacksonii]
MQNHPLPSAPGEQQRPGQGRQRTKSSAFSLHSHKSSGSGTKIEIIETHREKESLRLHGKADPSMAMMEAEPSAVANEASSLASIRALQHKDSQGNPIGSLVHFSTMCLFYALTDCFSTADPDRSNPTRSRWERPLDTIRAFEAAIDGNYTSRKSYIRTESDVGSTYNRRSSYFGENSRKIIEAINQISCIFTNCAAQAISRMPILQPGTKCHRKDGNSLAGAHWIDIIKHTLTHRRAGTQVTTDERPRYSQQSYYGSPQGYRQSQNGNGMGRPDSYYNGNNGIDNSGGPGNGYHPNRTRYPRTASEPHFNSGGNSVYPSSGVQHSYETVTTASGSGSSADPAGYSTDPSSENSSVDRIHAPQQKEPIETYGFNGFGNNPQYLPPGSGINDQQRPQPGYQNQGPSPQKDARVPIRLDQSNGKITSPAAEPARPAPQEKRKSWFGRRLSKK